MEDGVVQTFRDAMAGLASGVAVITARRSDGHPCGLVATSVSSFSANPPSALVSVSHTSRCHSALTEGTSFGVHILAAHQRKLETVFAGLGDDKFAGIPWNWDEDVPRIEGSLSYLRCRRSALFELYDHSLLVGDVVTGVVQPGDPLVYMGRRIGWRLEPTE